MLRSRGPYQDDLQTLPLDCDIQNYFDNIDPDEELSDLEDEPGGDGLLVDLAEYERILDDKEMCEDDLEENCTVQYAENNEMDGDYEEDESVENDGMVGKRKAIINEID